MYYPRVAEWFVPPTHHSHLSTIEMTHAVPKCSTRRYFGGSEPRGGFQSQWRRWDTWGHRVAASSPFKRNHSAPFISESRGSWRSVTTARHDMWWRLCSLLAWFPLQGKDFELISYDTQLTCILHPPISRLHSEDPRQQTTQVSMWLPSRLRHDHTWGDVTPLFNLLFNC